MNLILLLCLLPLGYGAGGGFGKYSGAYSPFIGIIFGIFFSALWYSLPLFALAGWLSEKPSPASGSLGAITDGHGNYKDYINLAKRGLMSALFYLPLYFVTSEVVLMLGFIVSYPLSAYLGTKLPKFTTWQWSEILRYFLVGVILVFI